MFAHEANDEEEEASGYVNCGPKVTKGVCLNTWVWGREVCLCVYKRGGGGGRKTVM